MVDVSAVLLLVMVTPVTVITTAIAAETLTTSGNNNDSPTTTKELSGVEELVVVATTIAVNKTFVVTDVVDPLSNTQEEPITMVTTHNHGHVAEVHQRSHRDDLA